MGRKVSDNRKSGEKAYRETRVKENESSGSDPRIGRFRIKINK